MPEDDRCLFDRARFKALRTRSLRFGIMAGLYLTGANIARRMVLAPIVRTGLGPAASSYRLCSIAWPRAGDQACVVRMPADVAGNELAFRHDPQTACPGIVQNRAGDGRADPTAR